MAMNFMDNNSDKPNILAIMLLGLAAFFGGFFGNLMALSAVTNYSAAAICLIMLSTLAFFISTSKQK